MVSGRIRLDFRTVVKHAVLAAVCLGCLGAVEAQTGVNNNEWHSYGGDQGHTKYSPLDQSTGTTSTRSYTLGGTQYIVVAVGGGDQPDELIAFALP